MSWDSRANLPPSFQITSVQEVNGQPVIPLNLDQYINNAGQDAGLASMTGPFTAEDNGFIPTGQPLPFTVNFQNDPQATTTPGEIRITTQLDPSLDPRTFRLGDIQVGDIDIHIPSNMGLFQGDFDFTQTKGFILRVSAGVDLQTGTATWLLQAIDPLTGAGDHRPEQGPAAAQQRRGRRRRLRHLHRRAATAGAATGTTITATATVLFNNAPPQDTAPLTYTLDTVAAHDPADGHAGRHQPELPGAVEQHRRRRRLGRQVRDAVRLGGRRRLPDLAGPGDRRPPAR